MSGARGAAAVRKQSNAINQSFEAELQRTSSAQAAAADPSQCVWVSANAGTGKTHVLTQRVLRLLLSGTAPEKILCLTYTKAAAAEMSKRLFETLATWVTLEPQRLSDVLLKLTGSSPSLAMQARARTLFTSAIETPGGLKVQTIHAFCERLLQRFPLEAGVSPSFSILDDDTTQKLTREAIDSVLTDGAIRPTSEIGRDLKTAVAYITDTRFDDVLKDALGHRHWIEQAHRWPQDAVSKKSGFDAVEVAFLKAFAVPAGSSVDQAARDIRTLLTSSQIARIRAVLEQGTSNDVDMAVGMTDLSQTASHDKFIVAMQRLFLTSKHVPRGKFLTKALAAAHPDVEDLLVQTQSKFLKLFDTHLSCMVTTATMALLRLAHQVMQRYTEAKAQRAALDYDDLIMSTSRLLATGSAPEWVLYKLDNGLDHLLVDESQDTSPQQWAIIESIAREFFNSQGAGTCQRTVFGVGDEKQSIYSFQGAAPGMFASVGNTFETAARQAGLDWTRVPLNMSFRTVATVLDAVDRTFADPARTPGLMSEPNSVRHIPFRHGHAGLVEIWPTEAHQKDEVGDPWSPLDDVAAAPTAIRAANRIAQTIKGWLDHGEVLASADRPVQPGDILILVRKRVPFAGPMVAALKSLGIPVAGADRMDLSKQIAVKDLMSLSDMLTVPDDDLALAEVLKSPIFGLSDDDLLPLCYKRKGTLWRSALKAADAEGANPKLRDAVQQLKIWRKSADFMPPFEFLASVLDKDGVRTKLLARLGPEASDAIDEFLNLAITYDDSAPPSLSGFLNWLRQRRHEIKRDMDIGRNQVRVMTVHAAKGLEAPIVFLPDTCSARSAGTSGGRPLAFAALDRPIGCPPAFVWPVAGAARLAAIAAAKHDLDKREGDERDRLLYVAMTRARDRLYISGFEGKSKTRDADCWYNKITEALADVVRPFELADGRTVLRVMGEQTVPPKHDADAVLPQVIAGLPPEWTTRPAPREPQLSVPLAPSRLAPYETNEEGDPLATEQRPPSALTEPVAAPPQSGAGDTKFLRGTLTHALLEHLPQFPRQRRREAAAAFVNARGAALSGRIRSNLIDEVLAVLDHPEFSALFAEGSAAEVSIAAEIPRPIGLKGPPLKLTGQIDRLAVTDEHVLIVDYKTNRAAPRSIEGVADIYLYQLAAYSLALKEIYPHFPIRAGLLWTETATLMEVPSALLSSFATRLWQLDVSRLDA